MVNLKEFLIDSSNGEEKFTKGFETIARYIRKNDAEFNSKVLRATCDIIKDATVSEGNKLMCLQLVHLGLVMRNELFIKAYFKELNGTLLKLLTGMSAGEGNISQRPGNIFKGINQNSDEKKGELFFRLLSECVFYWNDNLSVFHSGFAENVDEARKAGILRQAGVDGGLADKYLHMVLGPNKDSGNGRSSMSKSQDLQSGGRQSNVSLQTNTRKKEETGIGFDAFPTAKFSAEEDDKSSPLSFASNKKNFADDNIGQKRDFDVLVRQFVQNERESLLLRIEQANAANSELKQRLSKAELELTQTRQKLDESERKNADLTAQLSLRDGKAKRVVDELCEQFSLRKPRQSESQKTPLSTFQQETARPSTPEINKVSTLNVLAKYEKEFKFDKGPLELIDREAIKSPKPDLTSFGITTDQLIVRKTKTLDGLSTLPTTTSKHTDFAAQFAKKDFNPPDLPAIDSANRKDIDYFKETLKQNSDFLQSFNDDINSILNRDRSAEGRSGREPARTALANNIDGTLKGTIRQSPNALTDRQSAPSSSASLLADRMRQTVANKPFDNPLPSTAFSSTLTPRSQLSPIEEPHSDRKTKDEQIRNFYFGDGQGDYMANFMKQRK